jgi:hypothetical protein
LAPHPVAPVAVVRRPSALPGGALGSYPPFLTEIKAKKKAKRSEKMTIDDWFKPFVAIAITILLIIFYVYSQNGRYIFRHSGDEI